MPLKGAQKYPYYGKRERLCIFVQLFQSLEYEYGVGDGELVPP